MAIFPDNICTSNLMIILLNNRRNVKIMLINIIFFLDPDIFYLNARGTRPKTKIYNKIIYNLDVAQTYRNYSFL